MLKIYHNSRCAKSRQALEVLKKSGKEFEIIEYLKNIPTREELKDVLMKLNIKPKQLLRRNEAVFKEKFKNSNFNDEEWVDIMLEYPKLIERPIVVKDYKAVIGRPLENVIELLGGEV